MQIVCVSESARVNGSFSWLDFANSSGRLDVLARCAQIVLREQVFLPILTKVTFILSNTVSPKIMELNFKTHLREPISEFHIAEDLKELFTTQKTESRRSKFFRLHQGTLEDYLRNQNVHNTTETKARIDELLILEEEGQPIQELKGNLLSSTIIIGDQNGFSEKTVQLMKDYQGKSVSLGKNSYLSSHSLFLVLFETLKRTRAKLQTRTKT
ncbi:MAG: hypothetical protein ACXACA_08200 [Candidatus Ranarchaeia archaeon]|jgi:tRNA pseudouridine-54 N-methylase